MNLQEELEDRPRISTLISSLANYSNTIPAASEADAKPGQKSARMGKCYYIFFVCNSGLIPYHNNSKQI